MHDVRARALRSIAFKLDHHLVDVAQLVKEDLLLRHLLNWFNFEVTAPEALVLDLLQRLASHRTGAARMLSMAADQFLRQLRAHCDPGLFDAVDGVLLQLFALSPEDVSSSKLGRAEEARAGHAGVASSNPPSRITCSWNQTQTAASAETAAIKTTSSCALGRAHATRAIARAPPSPPQPSSLPMANAASTESLDTQVGACPEDNHHLEAGGPVEWVLPRVTMGASNEQFLFEVNVRLQYSEDPAVLTGALRELQEAVVEDFPAEAFLQKPAVLENAMSLLHTADNNRDVKAAALAFLQRFVLMLKTATALSEDAAFCMPPKGADSASDRPSDLDIHQGSDGSGRTLRELNYPPPDAHMFGGEGSTQWLSVTPSVHLVTVNVLALLGDHRLHRIALPTLRALQPLLHQPPKAALMEAGRTRFREYFRLIEAALLYLEQDAGLDDGQDDERQLARAGAAGVVHVATEVLQLLSARDAAAVLPPRLAVMLGDAACDEGLAVTLPHIREDLRAYLPAVCALAHTQLVAADNTVHALSQAASLGIGCAGLSLSPQADTPTLLEALGAAVRALSYTGDAAAARWYAHLCAGPELQMQAASAATESHDACAALMRTLLAHPRTEIGTAVYEALLETVGNPSARSWATAMDILTDNTVLREVAERGLHDAHTRTPASELLLEAARYGKGQQQLRLMRWLPWIECGAACRATQVAAESACNLLVPNPLCKPMFGTSSCASVPSGSWAELQPHMRKLFHVDAARRKDAAAGLQRLLWGRQGRSPESMEEAAFAEERAMGYRARNAEAWTDPFAGVLGINQGQFLHLSTARAAAPASLAQFQPSQVQDLVRVLTNVALGEEIRRTAADQLTSLSEAQRFGALLTSPELLSMLLLESSSLAAVSLDGAADGDGVHQAEPTSLQPNYSAFTPLALACLALLANLVCCYSEAQRWAMSAANACASAPRGSGMSPFTTPTKSAAELESSKGSSRPRASPARKGGARRAVTFSGNPSVEAPVQAGHISTTKGEVDRALQGPGGSSVSPATDGEGARNHVATEEAKASPATSPTANGCGDASAGASVTSGSSPRVMRLLHLVFHRNAEVRCHVARVLARLLFHPCVLDPVGARSHEDAQFSGTVWLPAPFVDTYRFPFPVGRCATPRSNAHEVVVSEADAEHVGDMVCARRFLGLHGADGCLELLHPNPGSVNTPMLRSTAQKVYLCLQATSLPAAYVAALNGLSAARSHSAAHRALKHIHLRNSLCESAPLSLASADWPACFRRFLSATPTTLEDHKLWTQILEILLDLLRTGELSRASLSHLTHTLSETGLPLLMEGSTVPTLHSRPKTTINFNSAPAPTPSLRHPMVMVKAASGDPDGAGGVRACTAATLMQVLEGVVWAARTSGDEALCAQAMAAMTRKEFVDAIMEGYVTKQDANYLGRVSAMRLYRQLAELHGDLARSASATGAARAYAPTVDPKWGHGLSRLVEPAIRHVAAVRYDSTCSFVGRSLLRQALGFLLAVCDGVSPRQWQQSWIAAGGSFWLSRLTRDHEGAVRAHAHLLLALLARPQAPTTRQWIRATWPEGANSLARVAQDPTECAAVRAAALRFVAAALLPCQFEKGRDNGRGNVACLGGDGSSEVLTILQRRDLWASLASLLQPHCTPPVLLRGATAVLLAAAQVDAATPATALDQAASWPALFEILRMDWLNSRHVINPDVWTPREMADPANRHASSTTRERVDLLAATTNVTALMGVLAGVWAASQPENESENNKNDANSEDSFTFCTPSAALVQNAGASASSLSLGTALLSSAAPLLLRLIRLVARAAVAPVSSPRHPHSAHSNQQTLRLLLCASNAACTLLSGASTNKIVAFVEQSERGGGGVGGAAATLAESIKCLLLAPSSLVSDQLRLAVCRLLATLLRSHECAGALFPLAAEARGQMDGGVGVSQTCAEATCRALVTLYWQFRQTHPAPDGACEAQVSRGEGGNASSDSRDGAVRTGSQAVVGAALRNLLAFSVPAKTAAVDAGLPRAVLANAADAHACMVMSAVHGLAAPSKPRSSVAVTTRNPGTASCRATRGGGAATTTTSAGTRGHARGARVAARDKDSKPGAGRRSASTGRPRDKAETSSARAGVSGRSDGDSGVSAEKGTRSVGVQEQGRHPKRTALGGRGYVLEIVSALSLLKHLVYYGKDDAGAVASLGDECGTRDSAGNVAASRRCLFTVREAVVRAGLMDTAAALWRFALTEEAVLHELLGLLTNVAYDCELAKTAMVEIRPEAGGAGVPTSVMALVMKLCTRPSVDTPAFALGMALLQTLVASEAVQAVFLRTSFLSDTESMLRRALAGKDGARAHTILLLLVNLAALAPGARHVLERCADARSHQPALTGGGSFLDLVLDVMGLFPGATSNAGLFLLRNLAFVPESKPHFLANRRALDTLTSVMEETAISKATALASSALWALLYCGAKVKSTLRASNIPKRMRAIEKTVLGELDMHVGIHEGDGEYRMLKETARNLAIVNELMARVELPTGAQ